MSRTTLNPIALALLPWLAMSCHVVAPYENNTWGTAADGGPRDRGTDACLPIPAADVQGKFSGGWQGTYTCPGQSWAINGTMALELSPRSSPRSFEVKGKMAGTATGLYTIMGDIEGSMDCSALSGTMATIRVSWLGLPVDDMSGKLNGVFSAPSGSGQQFQQGSWSAKQKAGSCTASGTWSAKVQ